MEVTIKGTPDEIAAFFTKKSSTHDSKSMDVAEIRKLAEKVAVSICHEMRRNAKVNDGPKAETQVPAKQEYGKAYNPKERYAYMQDMAHRAVEFLKAESLCLTDEELPAFLRIFSEEMTYRLKG